MKFKKIHIENSYNMKKVGLCKESGLNFLVIKFELSLQTGQIFKEEESNQEILMNPNEVLEFQILNL